MKTCCRECGAYQELRTFGYGEIYPECENCGAYLEDYSEHEKEQKELKKRKDFKKWIKHTTRQELNL